MFPHYHRVRALHLQTTQGHSFGFTGTDLSLMDLNLYGTVLRRHWRLVVPGVLLAFVLTFLSVGPCFFGRDRLPPTGGVAEPELALADAVRVPVRPGFPVSGSQSQTQRPIVRLAALTELYAQMASSDEVRRIMRRDGAPKTWKIVASRSCSARAAARYRSSGLSGQAFSGKDAEVQLPTGRGRSSSM